MRDRPPRSRSPDVGPESPAVEGRGEERERDAARGPKGPLGRGEAKSASPRARDSNSAVRMRGEHYRAATGVPDGRVISRGNASRVHLRNRNVRINTKRGVPRGTSIGLLGGPRSIEGRVEMGRSRAPGSFTVRGGARIGPLDGTPAADRSTLRATVPHVPSLRPPALPEPLTVRHAVKL